MEPGFVALHLLPEPAQPSVELVGAGVTVRAGAGTDFDWLASVGSQIDLLPIGDRQPPPLEICCGS